MMHVTSWLIICSVNMGWQAVKEMEYIVMKTPIILRIMRG